MRRWPLRPPPPPPLPSLRQQQLAATTQPAARCCTRRSSRSPPPMRRLQNMRSCSTPAAAQLLPTWSCPPAPAGKSVGDEKATGATPTPPAPLARATAACTRDVAKRAGHGEQRSPDLPKRPHARPWARCRKCAVQMFHFPAHMAGELCGGPPEVSPLAPRPGAALNVGGELRPLHAPRSRSPIRPPRPSSPRPRPALSRPTRPRGAAHLVLALADAPPALLRAQR